MKASLSSTGYTLLLVIMLATGCQQEISQQDIPHSNQTPTSLKYRKGESPAHIVLGRIDPSGKATLTLSDISTLNALVVSQYPSMRLDDLVFHPDSYGIEYDKYTRGRPGLQYYLRAEVDDLVNKGPAVLRLELHQQGNILYLRQGRQNVLHVHTCSHKPVGKPCDFIYNENGFYAGCTCGGDEEIYGLAEEKI